MNPMNLYGDTLINEYEVTSVRALIAYAAYSKNISEDTVSEVFKTKFNAPKITKLLHRDYDNAIRFLIDLDIGEILN